MITTLATDNCFTRHPMPLFLRKIAQASLRQIGSTSLEVGILVDQLCEHLQHFSLRFRHLLSLLDWRADAGNVRRYF
jgi:hypothetical protein